jgi:hypothetical protein
MLTMLPTLVVVGAVVVVVVVVVVVPGVVLGVVLVEGVDVGAGPLSWMMRVK